jgi:hypothetical protein
MWVSVLAGCNNTGMDRYVQDPLDTDVGTHVTEEDDADADSDADADADSDADADADSDADADADSDADIACHPFDPIELFGWTRDYAVTNAGQAGTETQSGAGLTVTAAGDEAYLVETSVVIGGVPTQGEVYANCDADGAYLLQHSDTLSVSGLAIPVTIVSNPPQTYLPPADDIGDIGAWTFSTQNEIDLGLGLPIPIAFAISGTYVELGFKSITVQAGTFDAYYLTNEYTEDRSALDLLGAGGVVNAFAEYYYVEGLGLVYEKVVDSDSGAMLRERELLSYSGLTPKG